MASHGVTRTARPRTDEQRQQDLDKIHRYRSLEDQLRQQAASKSYGPDTFQLTSKLLRLNPEYYTVWNVRRRCLISGQLSKRSAGSWPSTASPTSSANATTTPSSAAWSPSSSTEIPQAPDSQTAGTSGTTPEAPTADERAVQNDLEAIRSELAFTIPLLMEFPKCYWIWNYRIWILSQATDRLPVKEARKIWEEELGLVGKMLLRDRRNFHAWTYRRHVVEQLESPALAGRSMVAPEFDYTTKAIERDLSNFSAWHNRSQLIPRLLDEREADDESRKNFLEKELEHIRGALNVGPGDQSLWYYHQYLILNVIGHSSRPTIVPHLSADERVSYISGELAEIKDLLEDFQDVKWIYEALIEYTMAIYQLRSRQLEDEETAEVAVWLRKLKELDPKRSGRWHDWKTELSIP